jgi:hypothetical protein
MTQLMIQGRCVWLWAMPGQTNLAAAQVGLQHVQHVRAHYSGQSNRALFQRLRRRLCPQTSSAEPTGNWDTSFGYAGEGHALWEHLMLKHPGHKHLQAFKHFVPQCHGLVPPSYVQAAAPR